MKSFIGLSALAASAVFFVGDAQAGHGGGCHCPCVTAPASAPARPPAATTATPQGTTSYSSAYQPPAAGGAAVAPAPVQVYQSPARPMNRVEELWEFQRQRHGGR